MNNGVLMDFSYNNKFEKTKQMSLNLLNSYEGEYVEQIDRMKLLLQDQERLSKYLKVNRDPKEYTQSQNLLKQMEIESMNFMESSEYAQNRREGDLIRKKIQKHKREFDQVRREMRQAQDRYDKISGTNGTSTEAKDLHTDLEQN